MGNSDERAREIAGPCLSNCTTLHRDAPCRACVQTTLIASARDAAERRGFLVGTEAAAEYAEVSGQDALASEIRTLHPGHYLSPEEPGGSGAGGAP